MPAFGLNCCQAWRGVEEGLGQGAGTLRPVEGVRTLAFRGSLVAKQPECRVGAVMGANQFSLVPGASWEGPLQHPEPTSSQTGPPQGPPPQPTWAQ